MTQNLITVNSLRYNLSLRRSWECELVSDLPEGIICRGEFRSSVEHEHLGKIENGTISVEHFPSGKWYNYFDFYEVSGAFRNYYINIAMPATLTGSALNFVDLDIDIIVWPDRSYEVVDLDEFEENSALFNYPHEVRQCALKTLDDLEAEIKARRFPSRPNDIP